MAVVTLYKLAPTNTRMIDAHLEFDRISPLASAVTIHSRSGGPPRNSEYPEALLHILSRLLPDSRVAAVLMDSSTSAYLPRGERLLFLGGDLGGLSPLDAAKAIRAKAMRFGQAEGTKGGNSTKRLRIETSFPIHSLITTLHVRKVDSRADESAAEPRQRVSRKRAEELLEGVPFTEEELRCVENEKRMAQHFRTERTRLSKLPKAKRTAVRAANNGLYICENESCPSDWYAVFPPEIAEGVFEVHHIVPLSHLEDAVENTVEDLIMLCASCHRAEHR